MKTIKVGCYELRVSGDAADNTCVLYDAKEDESELIEIKSNYSYSQSAFLKFVKLLSEKLENED